MSKSFSRRGFGGLLLTGGAGLLLGTLPGQAEARRVAGSLLTGRLLCQLDADELSVQLFLRSRTPTVLPHRLITMSGVLTLPGRRHTLESQGDSRQLLRITSRTGTARPAVVRLSEEEAHYATFSWSSPPGLMGSGEGTVSLRAAREAPALPPEAPHSDMHRDLGRLSLVGRVRYAI